MASTASGAECLLNAAYKIAPTIAAAAAKVAGIESSLGNCEDTR